MFSLWGAGFGAGAAQAMAEPYLGGTGAVPLLCTWGRVFVPGFPLPGRTRTRQEQCVMGNPKTPGVVFLPELLHHTLH